jgi:hypothetical protein
MKRKKHTVCNTKMFCLKDTRLGTKSEGVGEALSTPSPQIQRPFVMLVLWEKMLLKCCKAIKEGRSLLVPSVPMFFLVN